MSKAEILDELPKLDERERAEVFAKLCELEDVSGPTSAERAVLDQELIQFQQDKNLGAPWQEVENRLRIKSKA